MNYYRIQNNEDGPVTIPDVPAGSFRAILIPINTDAKGFRSFYRGVVLPWMNNAKIVKNGKFENEDDTHIENQLQCNGARTTAGMDKGQWNRFIVRLQAYCIEDDNSGLDIGWPF